MARSLAQFVRLQVDIHLPGGRVQFGAAPGERIRLAGCNGCGKTTLLRAIAGLPVHVEATVRLDESNPADMTANEAADSIDYIPHIARDAFIGLTVAGEARLRGLICHDGRDISTLSAGEARHAALNLAQSPVLLLDEPNEGLDAAGIEALAKRMEAHEGIVIFADHGPLARLATNTIQLTTTDNAPIQPFQPAGDDVVLDMPAWKKRNIEFPPLQLGTGIHALTGPNGCGKSTWLRALAALDEVQPRVDGQPCRPGDVRLLLPEARDHLLTTVVEHDENWRVPASHPWQLSAGETQRAALAKILERPTRVVLLDEPEAHLDSHGRALLVDRLRALANGHCIVIATHDEALIAAASSEVQL